MSRRPPCPICSEEELFVVREKRFTVIRCADCGWHHTFMPPPAEAELNAAIEAAVTKAKKSLTGGG